ncbi:NUDIX domain-containing protein [Rhizobium halophytocola]|uniref:GDP-mannose pyrophosphatase n=1 Tax=Rhizobium halophytocola TaxID=735519 RepID=A0ABS4DYE8_9HYPH|nr:NUDIX hydrolase [Rhizobium halophytocola]MBP1850719.1 nudix-type nucleoside diphosphatase (YffH/AdpP family) [Rhizobium halophytocola]
MAKFDRTRIDLVEDETVWKGWSHVRRVTLDYTGDEGDTHRLRWEVFDRGHAVAVLLHDPARNVIVMVRQFRLPVHLSGDAPFLLEVPAGSLEKDEDPGAAIVREVLEETGYRIDAPELLFAAYMSPGSVTEKIHFYHAPVSEAARVEDGGGLDEEHEDLDIVEVSLDEAMAMIADGRIIDAKTIMLVQWLVLDKTRMK